jgi:hypothetical protein
VRRVQAKVRAPSVIGGSATHQSLTTPSFCWLLASRPRQSPFLCCHTLRANMRKVLHLLFKLRNEVHCRLECPACPPYKCPTACFERRALPLPALAASRLAVLAGDVSTSIQELPGCIVDVREARGAQQDAAIPGRARHADPPAQECR